MSEFDFKIQLSDSASNARAAILATPHGDIETPIFMPVGTRASVKGILPEKLDSIGTQIILANAYHLFLRPGTDIVKNAGGIHDFMNWQKPILTDSGGFQVFSLADSMDIDDDGLRFASIYDGQKFAWTPEKNMQIQRDIGADIVMQLDQCSPYPQTRENVKIAVERSAAWAKRCRLSHLGQNSQKKPQALFGIVQGGVYEDLRMLSIEMLLKAEEDVGRFEGFGIGGYSVGEPHELMFETLPKVCAVLPQDRPHYLMGVGDPSALLRGIAAGVDMFDCVLPTRTARMGTAFSNEGRLNIRNARFANDFSPLDSTCTCEVCQSYSRAYIRHLLMSKEMLSGILLSIHNLHYLLDLAKRARKAILNQDFDTFLKYHLDCYARNDYC